MKNKFIRNRPKPKDKATMHNIKIDDECFDLLMRFSHGSEGLHTILKWHLVRDKVPDLSYETAVIIYDIFEHTMTTQESLSLEEFKTMINNSNTINSNESPLTYIVDKWTDEQYEALLIGIKMAVFMPGDYEEDQIIYLTEAEKN